MNCVRLMTQDRPPRCHSPGAGPVRVWCPGVKQDGGFI